MIVALEYTFFQLRSYAEQISVRLARFRRRYVKRRTVVLTVTQVTQHFCLMCAALFKVVAFLFFILQLFVPVTNFVEHTSYSNVVKSNVGKPTQRRKDVK